MFIIDITIFIDLELFISDIMDYYKFSIYQYTDFALSLCLLLILFIPLVASRLLINIHRDARNTTSVLKINFHNFLLSVMSGLLLVQKT